MSAELVDHIRQYLRGVEATQEELTELYQRKRTALTAARASDLMRIARAESELTGKLQAHQAHRQRILQESAQAGLPGDTLQSLVTSLDDEARVELERRMQRVRGVTAQVRRESWIHWIIAQRSVNHYNELLEIIAHSGRKSPTYNEGERRETSAGGAIMDTSA